MRFLIFFLVFAVAVNTSCGDTDTDDFVTMMTFNSPHTTRERNSAFKSMLTQTIAKLEPFQTIMPEPGPEDWLANHEEKGQTFEEYLDANPVMIDDEHKILYIQPLGDFTDTQQKIVNKVAEYMNIFFNAEVRIMETLDLSVIPEDSQRHLFGNLQLKTPYILNKVLYPRLPKDAAVYLCFTAVDLYPEDDWNFVFGQANLRTRCGVWSINRFGNPDKSDEDYRYTLRRTLATATHETGHMFTIKHCIKWKCNMNGSNNLEESESRDIWLCPECHAKVCWATGAEPVERYEKLAKFCKNNDLTREFEHFSKFSDALKKENSAK